MKNVIVSIGLLTGSLGVFNATEQLVNLSWPIACTQTDADAILGKWTNEDRTRMIEFVKDGDAYTAIIREAPDHSIVGKNQLTGMVYGAGVYTGNVQLPKKGKSYPCRLSVRADGAMELTVRAGLMSRSQLWTRVK